VQELLDRYPEGHQRAGQFRFSAWWVRHRFAPDAKRKIGGQCVWYEGEAQRWIDRQGFNR
jgi:hypothetical protein